MAKGTATEVADKLIPRLSAATEDIRKGIDRVTEAPGAKAAASADLMLQKLTEAIQSGRWAELVGAVSLSEWKRLAKEKGVPRIATGIQGARGKLEKFFTALLPFADTVSQEVQAMPKGTLEDGIARATHTIRRMASFRKPA